MTPAARQVLNALEAAGDDGCTARELWGLGGRWYQQRLRELGRLGFKVGEQHGLYYLVAEMRHRSSHPRDMSHSRRVASTEPPASGDRPPVTDAGLPGPEFQAGAGGSVEAAETLFEVPAVSVYDLDAAA